MRKILVTAGMAGLLIGGGGDAMAEPISEKTCVRDGVVVPCTVRTWHKPPAPRTWHGRPFDPSTRR